MRNVALGCALPVIAGGLLVFGVLAFWFGGMATTYVSLDGPVDDVVQKWNREDLSGLRRMSTELLQRQLDEAAYGRRLGRLRSELGPVVKVGWPQGVLWHTDTRGTMRSLTRGLEFRGGSGQGVFTFRKDEPLELHVEQTDGKGKVWFSVVDPRAREILQPVVDSHVSAYDAGRVEPLLKHFPELGHPAFARLFTESVSCWRGVLGPSSESTVVGARIRPAGPGQPLRMGDVRVALMLEGAPPTWKCSWPNSGDVGRPLR